MIDNINIKENDYEVVSSFKYPGANITQNNDVTLEIKERIASGNRFFYAFTKIIRLDIFPRNRKFEYIKQ